MKSLYNLAWFIFVHCFTELLVLPMWFLILLHFVQQPNIMLTGNWN